LKKPSFLQENNEETPENRGLTSTSLKKPYRNTKGSILSFQLSKRQSSISISPRKPSFLSEFDEKKKMMNVLDVYSEEQLINVIYIGDL